MKKIISKTQEVFAKVFITNGTFDNIFGKKSKYFWMSTKGNKSTYKKVKG
jgi:hypothetical protein